MAKPQELIPVNEPRAVITPPEMVAQALAQGASIETLERFMAMSERWQASQAKRAYDTAKAAAKAEMPPIFKNKAVSFGQGKTSYRHETLEEVLRTIQPTLSKYGLDPSFRTAVEGHSVIVTCRLTHTEGHFEETSLPGPADTSGSKNPIQAIGSTVSYLERYTLKALLGLAASDDDDGQAAGRRGQGDGDPFNLPITDKQAHQLFDLARDVGADVARFCTFLKIASIDQLPAARFNEALHALEAKGSRA